MIDNIDNLKIIMKQAGKILDEQLPEKTHYVVLVTQDDRLLEMSTVPHVLLVQMLELIVQKLKTEILKEDN